MVWAPQSTGTDRILRGAAGSEMSKIWMPSKPGVEPGVSALSHPRPVWGRSTARNSSPSHTATSPWPPWHFISDTTRGAAGSETSMTLKPS